MADTTEIKKVITIDAGNSIQTLSDYKTKIDTLKNSLDNLDESSDEYAKTIKEIDDLQNELNSVVDEGSDSLDSLGSSYENLSSKAGKFKNNLKDIGDSTDNLHSSISDYSGAFETAFDKMLDGVESVDGPIGEVGGTVKNMIPVIKSVNSTAVSGLKGVKKAIASTGIGLLVVAVATLVTHWEDFTKVVGISQEKISEFKERALDALKNIVTGTVGVGNAIGTFLLAPIRTTIEAFKGLGNIVKDVFTGDFGKVKEDAEAAFNAIKGIGKQAIDFKQNYAAGKEAAENLIVTINERLSSKDAEAEVKESSKTIGKAISEGISEGVSDEEVDKEIDSKTQSILDRLHKRNTDEIELLREKYEEERALLEQYGIDTTELTEEFEANAEAIIDKRLEAERKAINEQQKLEEALTAKKKEESEKQLAIKKKEQMALLSSTTALFGALSELAEEGSEEAKAFSIMQTILNTLQSIMGIWAGYSEMGPFGVAAAAVQTAAVTALGVATIAKMKSTTKDNASSGSASVAAPQVPAPSMTSVTPLLDEQADLNRLETSGVQGDSSTGTTNMRVYVVDQDIRDANHRAEVVEDNATF
jgi:hypothetical protein